MKNIFFILFLISLLSCNSGNKKKEITTRTNNSNEFPQQAEPFAVVELFTSEGCSDCPAAEELLNRITREAMANKTYVYPIAFHVDYWNKLGWRDVFSDTAYSNRQRKYRKPFGNEVVYTPQMIINGEVEFAGSNEKKADSVISAMLKKVPEFYFSIHPDETSTGKDSFAVEYEIIQMPETKKLNDYYLCFALVERGLTTEVTRGENKGKKLFHENIVRIFTIMETDSISGKKIIPSLKKPLSKNHSLIAFIQEKSSMRIVGANLWNF